jgi:hypothetical protein
MHLPPVLKFRRLAPAAPDQLETDLLQDVIDLNATMIDTCRTGVMSATATPHFGCSHLSHGVVRGATNTEQGVQVRCQRYGLVEFQWQWRSCPHVTFSFSLLNKAVVPQLQSN